MKNDLTELLQNATDHIKNGNTFEAINILITGLKKIGGYNDESNGLLLFSNRYKECEKKEDRNLAPPNEINIEKNNIKEGLIKLIQQINHKPAALESPKELPAIFGISLSSWKGTEKEELQGRNEDINKISELLEKGESKILLIGTSGVGKSSFVRAGLGKKELISKCKNVVVNLRDAENPFTCLALAFNREKLNLLNKSDINNFMAQIDKNIPKLINDIKIFLKEKKQQLLLIVDQFEELLYDKQNNKNDDLKLLKEPFQTFLAECAQLEDVYIMLVLTASAYEAWNKCQLFKQPEDHFITHNLKAIKGKELESMVFLPLKRVLDYEINFSFKHDLSKIVCDKDDCIDLPLLCLILEDLREKYLSDYQIFKKEEIISMSDFGELIQNKITKALRYDDDKETLHELFYITVGLNQDERPFRKRMQLSGINNHKINELVKRLMLERILNADQEAFELAHDILLTQWEDLKLWIAQNKPTLLVKTSLSQAISRWEKTEELCGFDEWSRYYKILNKLSNSERTYLDVCERDIVKKALAKSDKVRIEELFSIKLSRESTPEDKYKEEFFFCMYPDEISELDNEDDGIRDEEDGDLNTLGHLSDFNDQSKNETTKKIINYFEPLIHSDLLPEIIYYSTLAENKILTEFIIQETANKEVLQSTMLRALAKKKLKDFENILPLFEHHNIPLPKFYTKDGWSISTISAYYNNIEVIKYIDKKNYDLTVKDGNERTALQIAAIWHSLDVIKYLFSQQKAPDPLLDEDENRLLHFVAKRKVTDREDNLLSYLKNLIDKNQLNPFALNKSNQTPLHISLINNNKRLSMLYSTILIKELYNMPQNNILKLYQLATLAEDQKILDVFNSHPVLTDYPIHPERIKNNLSNHMEHSTSWPFQPLVPSAKWHELNVKESEKLIKKAIIGIPSESIQEVEIFRAARTYKLTCYPYVDFFEISITLKNGAIMYINLLENLNNKEMFLLDGKSEVIHEFNKGIKLLLDTEIQAKEYLQFFCHALCSESGATFDVVESFEDIIWEPKSNIEKLPEVLVMRCEKLDVNKDNIYCWQISGTVCYEKRMFKADFKISEQGLVEMVDDQALAEDLPIMVSTFRNGFRGVRI